GSRQQVLAFRRIGRLFRFRNGFARLSLVVINRCAQFRVAPALWSVTRVVDLSAHFPPARGHCLARSKRWLGANVRPAVLVDKSCNQINLAIGAAVPAGISKRGVRAINASRHPQYLLYPLTLTSGQQ